MPRIRDAYLDCTIYLYASEPDAEAGARTGGSGFLVGIPTVDLPSNVWISYAVTNKHVVENGNSVVRLRTKDGKHLIMSIDERAWVFHPNGDDLAVCLIQFDWQTVRYNFVPRDVLLDKRISAHFNIGPGDDTFVIGRFINHEGRQQNLPTVRFGTIAQMPLEPVKQDSGFEQESFLVESRSIGGYSGSPVFVHIPALSSREGVPDWVPPPPPPMTPGKMPDFAEMQKMLTTEWGGLKNHGPWLLGVDWGHIHDWEPVRDESGRPVNPAKPKAARVRMNTGIMTVVPAWKLIEMLDEGPLAENRKEGIEAIREYQEANPSTATSD